MGDCPKRYQASKTLFLFIKLTYFSHLSMWKILPLVAAASAQQAYQPVQSLGAPAAPAMDPMMMMLLMKDDSSSSMKKLLPLMMMGQGGAGGMGGMDPMMMMLLMDDSSSSSSNDLLPLLMMGGMGGQPGQPGAMNPMMMMALLGDDCKPKTHTALSALTDEQKAKVALGTAAFYDSAYKTTLTGLTATQIQSAALYIDFEYVKCKNGGGSMDSLLPLMMGGGQMDPMMMMLMGDGGDDLLPLMMMGGMGGQQPGQQAGMNPMMMLTLLGDDDKTKVACDKKYKVSTSPKITKVSSTSYTISQVTSSTDIRAVYTLANQVDLGNSKKFPDFTADTYAKKYQACIAAATSEGTSSDSSLKKLLPLMMMGQQPGQQMDPMMMMLLLK